MKHLFLIPFLFIGTLNAKPIYKIITVHKLIGWKWNVDAKQDLVEFVHRLDELSHNKDIKDITPVCDHVVYYQAKFYQDVTKTVVVGDNVAELKKLVYERMKDNNFTNSNGNTNEWDVFFSGDWALIQTGGMAMFDYYYKMTPKGWIEMNEPFNGEYTAKGQPTFHYKDM